jgi:hypothetical protein
MQHHFQTRPPAIRPVPIEVEGEPVGILVTADNGYRFVAVRLSAFGSDGQVFATPEAAREAVAAEVAGHRN